MTCEALRGSTVHSSLHKLFCACLVQPWLCNKVYTKGVETKAHPSTQRYSINAENIYLSSHIIATSKTTETYCKMSYCPVSVFPDLHSIAYMVKKTSFCNNLITKVKGNKVSGDKNWTRIPEQVI